MSNHIECLDLSFNDPNSNELTNLSLVCRVLSIKTVNNKAIIDVLQNTWNLGPNVHIKTLDRNLVAYTFSNAKDRDRIEEAGPWSIKGALLNLKKWSSDLTLEEVSFSHCNLWIQIHNLPPNRRNRENLHKLGKYLGEFIRHDATHSQQSLQMFVRILVSVNMQDPL